MQLGRSTKILGKINSHPRDDDDDDDDDDASPVVIAGPGKTQAFAVYIYIYILIIYLTIYDIWDVYISIDIKNYKDIDIIDIIYPNNLTTA